MKKTFIPLAISLFFVIVGIFAYSSILRISFMDIMELKTIDLRFRYRGEIKPRSEVVLAVIDEKSLANEGKWIWPRSKLAKLVTKLSDAGAKVIAFDICFVEPDENDDQILKTIDKIEKHVLESGGVDMSAYLEELRKEADNDGKLVEAIKNSKAKVVLGHFFQMDEAEALNFTEEDISRFEKNISTSEYGFVGTGKDPGKAKRYVPQAIFPKANIGSIADASDYSGYFNMILDEDGTVRHIPSVWGFMDKYYAPLSLTALSSYLDESLGIKFNEYGVASLHIGNIEVPVDNRGKIRLNYRGEQKRFPHVSITDILSDKIPHETFKDKIVFIGATAIGIYDLRVTPFDEVFPGLEVHANAVDMILQGDFLQKGDLMVFFDVVWLMAVGLVLGILLPRLGGIAGSASTAIVFFGHIFLAQFLFSNGWIINLVYPLSVILLVYASITTYKYFTEERQKSFIKGAFSTYLAPSVVDLLIDNPNKLVLGGEERVITAFFSDLQGFTSISEKLAPNELVELLNEFLTEMTDIILKHQGTVDKFEGDAIIAFYGAPIDLGNQAEAACLSSIDMQRRLAEIRADWREKNKPELRMRIGLCTGPATVGNMGSRNRMDYTMMGDTVNTAARLEGVNKLYGTYTLIGQKTKEAVADKGLLTRELDIIQVVGKVEPIRIYELIGLKEENGDMAETVQIYEEAIKSYQKGDWPPAMKLFMEALERTPNDRPSEVMLERCREFMKNPPVDWRGVHTMKTK